MTQPQSTVSYHHPHHPKTMCDDKREGISFRLQMLSREKKKIPVKNSSPRSFFMTHRINLTRCAHKKPAN